MVADLARAVLLGRAHRRRAAASLAPVMQAALQRADASSSSRAAASTRRASRPRRSTWLEANGSPTSPTNAVVAINTATPGTPRRDLDEIEAHFQSRVREVVRIPYDPELVAGSSDALRRAASRSPAIGARARRARRWTACDRRRDRRGGMTERQIRLFGDPVLRSVSDPVTVGAGRPAHRGPRRGPGRHRHPARPRGCRGTQIGVGLRAFSYNVDGEIGYVHQPGARGRRASPSSSTRAASRCPASTSRACATRARG